MNRKISQQLAAKEMLLKIVNSDQYNEFGIQGSTIEEARGYILSLQADLGNEELLTKENWVGKCDELCMQKKISIRPEYLFEEEVGADNSKIFVCTCSLRDIVVKEFGGSKKKAKSSAAQSMYKFITGIKETEVSPKSAESKEKSAKDDDIIPIEVNLNAEKIGLTEEIYNELKLRLQENHSNCNSDEKLLRQICLLENNTLLNKIWPQRNLVFYLDAEKELVDLDARKDRNFAGSTNYRVFLEVQDGKTGQSINLFMGNGKTLNGARSQVSCRALSYLQAKFGIR